MGREANTLSAMMVLYSTFVSSIMPASPRGRVFMAVLDSTMNPPRPHSSRHFCASRDSLTVFLTQDHAGVLRDGNGCVFVEHTTG